MNIPGSDPRRGAALFIVLMLCALLAGLAGAIMRSSLSGARAATAFLDVARADELGRAAADIMTYHLAKADADAQRGGSLLVRLGDAEISIDYVSESARIDANMAPPALIAALLSGAGADASLTAAVAERIGKLRAAAATSSGTKPTGSRQTVSEKGTTSDASPTSPTAAPALQTTLEAVAAWGLPDDLARRVLPSLTVANGTAQVDPILAGRPIVSALLGGDDARVEDYLARRTQGFVDSGSALALLPVPAQSFAGFTDAPAVRALARVRVARRIERRYEMVVAPAPGPGQAPAVVWWQKLL